MRQLGRIGYQAAWDLQREVAEQRLQGGPDTVLLLEHDPVYTAGKRTRPSDCPTDGTPVIPVDRGGRITWHGPGQLVAYPLIRLRDPIDVVAYVRILEQALIATCAEFGLSTGRVAGRSGVWLAADDARPERKIAAIGVRIAKGITQHGYALNCNPDMTAYDRIVPCGIEDAGVTSLSRECGREITVAQVLPIAQGHLLAALDGKLPVTEADLPRPETPTGVRWQLDEAIRT